MWCKKPERIRPEKSEENVSCREKGKEDYESVAITLLFIASFFPYVIIVIVYITNPDYENNMTSSQLTFYLIAFRLYNINNMANPIFYFFFDVKFREEVFSLYRSFWKTEQEKSLKSAT